MKARKLKIEVDPGPRLLSPKSGYMAVGCTSRPSEHWLARMLVREIARSLKLPMASAFKLVRRVQSSGVLVKSTHE